MVGYGGLDLGYECACAFVILPTLHKTQVFTNIDMYNLTLASRYVEAWEAERTQQREREAQQRLEAAKKRKEEGEVSCSVGGHQCSCGGLVWARNAPTEWAPWATVFSTPLSHHPHSQSVRCCFVVTLSARLSPFPQCALLLCDVWRTAMSMGVLHSAFDLMPAACQL